VCGVHGARPAAVLVARGDGGSAERIGMLMPRAIQRNLVEGMSGWQSVIGAAFLVAAPILASFADDDSLPAVERVK
jgi:hypothetical protein